MPDNDLQSLKQHPKVLDLYRTRLALKQDGKRWGGLCPFHGDRHSGNFHVYPHEGTLIYKCQSCSASGSILDLLQKTDGVDFKGAVKIAREFCSEWAGNRARTESVFKPVTDQKPVNKTYPEEAYKSYEQAFQTCPQAQEFLRSRGIDPSTASRLRVGYRQDIGKFAGDAAQAVASRGWITFATFSRESDESPVLVSSVKFRSIAGKFFSKMPGMGTYLWNTQTIDCLEPVYLVEGELDALSLEMAGFRAVSLPAATYQLTPADKDLLLTAEYVVLAGDNDAPGLKAMDKLFREMKERTYWLRWPDKIKDANQFLMEKCDVNRSVFRTEIQKLVEIARTKPMTGVYDVRQSLLTANHTSSVDNPDRLRLPWESVDRMALIGPGDVVTIYSTDSGMGKTSLVLQASLFGAIKHGETVLNYQAEMTPQQIDTILASHLLRKDRLTLSEEDYRAAGHILPANTKYYIGRDTSLTNIGQVLDLIEAAARRFGATVVILDNLHFLSRNENDPIKAQANAMQRIKNLAGEYGLKWINVHQARKADQSHKRKRTHVSDLDGSKAVQNDSSVIFSIHREEIKHERDEQGSNHEYDPITEITLQKVRDKGPGGSYTTLMFAGNISTFTELTRVEEPELFRS